MTFDVVIDGYNLTLYQTISYFSVKVFATFAVVVIGGSSVFTIIIVVLGPQESKV